MRKWNIPLTYPPKIEPVKKGYCTQTIRIITVNKKTGKCAPKKEVGDLIRFYTWLGRPYHSKRETITEYMPIVYTNNIKLFEGGITHEPFDGCMGYDYTPWKCLDDIATLDGIVPPTGEALRDVLISKSGKIPKEGIEAQIIRWQHGSP